MHSFKDCHFISDVGGRREAKPTSKAGSEIAEDVTIHVRGDDDIELLGTHGKLVRAIVDENLTCLDLRVFLGDVVEGVLEHAFRELHDVGLRRAVNALSSFGNRKLECEPHDLLASMP